MFYKVRAQCIIDISIYLSISAKFNIFQAELMISPSLMQSSHLSK